MSNIWITSDPHFCHNKEFLYEPRNFDGIWEMNSAIVDLHNEIVEPIKYKGYRFFLTHYPTLCNNWDDGKELKQKVINICGHTHTKDPFIDWSKGTIFHCELDTNYCKPWLLDDIIVCLKEKYK